MVKTTDLRQGDNATELGMFDCARFRCVLGKRQVGTRAVVVAEVAAQTTSKVCLVQDDDVVEKLAADGADDSLGERVLPGRAWCSENLGQAHALRSSLELAPVDAVAITE